MLKWSRNICVNTGFTINSDLLLTYLLTELTYWRQFHFLFITFFLYISLASCSFMHLTTLVSMSVSVFWSRQHAWNVNSPVCYKMYPTVPPSKKRVQSDIRQFLGLLNSSVTNVRRCCSWVKPSLSVWTSRHWTGLHLDMTHPYRGNEFATEARRLKLIV